MPWVTVRNSRYYRRSRRRAGKVVTEYFGTGPFAEKIADCDAHARQLRAADRRRQAAWADALAADIRTLWAIDRALLGIFTTLAYQSGVHLHRRQWRRHRGASLMAIDPSAARAVLQRLHTPPGPAQPRDLTGVLPEDHALLEAAARGDREALRQAERYLSDPTYVDRWGNPTHAARLWLVLQVGQGDAVTAQATDRSAKSLAESLGWSQASLLEKLAVTRVVHGWLMVSALETWVMQAEVGSRVRSSLERSLTQAERRLQQAMRTLAYLRRMRPGAVREAVSSAGTAGVEGAEEGPGAAPRWSRAKKGPAGEPSVET